MSDTILIGGRTFRVRPYHVTADDVARGHAGVDLDGPAGEEWRLVRRHDRPTILFPIQRHSGLGGVAGAIRFHMHPATGDLRCVRQPQTTTTP
jgi:hypothetical protein